MISSNLQNGQPSRKLTYLFISSFFYSQSFTYSCHIIIFFHYYIHLSTSSVLSYYPSLTFFYTQSVCIYWFIIFKNCCVRNSSTIIFLFYKLMSEFSLSGQNSGLGQAPKIFTPYIPPPKSFQPYTPTIPVSVSPNVVKNNEAKNEEPKLSKFTNSPNTYGQGIGNYGIKGENNNFKPIPNFLQNRNVMMKGSMMASENQAATRTLKLDNSQQLLNNNQGQSFNSMGRKQVRIAQNPDMKFSSIQFGSEGFKVPSFLNDKTKQKKSPYFNGFERPQSSKDGVNFKIGGSDSLANSYGNTKKSSSVNYDVKQCEIKKDLATEWKSSSSFNKKKQKTFILNDFEKIKQLGTGKYGKVYLVYQKQTNFICALKVLQKSLIKQQQITEQLIRQLKIQSFLNHTNLIKMYGFFQDQHSIYLIMQAATGGQLFKQLKKHNSMPQPKVATIMRQVCAAVNQLHSHQIIHRDIKPENIVLHDNIIKLCDFGWSVYCNSNLRTTFCGTPLYVGPEILKGKQYDEKIDIWSLGVMMYEMLVGQNPFKISREQDLIKIIKDQIKIPNYVQISKQAEDFLYSCLQKNPDNRLSIRELMNHDFFKKYPEKSDKKLA